MLVVCVCARKRPYCALHRHHVTGQRRAHQRRRPASTHEAQADRLQLHGGGLRDGDGGAEFHRDRGHRRGFFLVAQYNSPYYEPTILSFALILDTGIESCIV